MVKSCSSYNCCNKLGDKAKEANITFHQFPASLEVRQKWITATHRSKFYPSKGAVLCSQHFSEDCFVTKDESFGSMLRKRLHPNAIPTIFEGFPNHLQPQPFKKRRTVTSQNFAYLVGVYCFNFFYHIFIDDHKRNLLMQMSIGIYFAKLCFDCSLSMIPFHLL
jgi:THAP domain